MISKKALSQAKKAVVVESTGSVVPFVGETHRIEQDAQITSHRTEISEALEGVISSKGLQGRVSEEQKRTLVSAIINIKQAFVTATKSLLDVGRELYELHRRDPVLYEIVTRTPGVLPFRRQTAHKYKRVWIAVGVDRTFREDELPASLFNAYKVVTWKPEVQKLAREKGIIRCDAQRSELLDFETSVVEKAEDDTESALRARQARLETRRDDLQDEIMRIDAELVEIRGKLAALSRGEAAHA